MSRLIWRISAILQALGLWWAVVHHRPGLAAYCFIWILISGLALIGLHYCKEEL